MNLTVAVHAVLAIEVTVAIAIASIGAAVELAGVKGGGVTLLALEWASRGQQILMH